MKARILLIVMLLSALLIPPNTAQAQQDVQRPIDMMILIDNSCSMFPVNRILASCDAFGNDPDYLRVIGADLFLARLGFGEPNENDYQAGIVNIGEFSSIVSPLQPLNGMRDSLAKLIANPEPQAATGLVPAMELAYNELASSPNRRTSNLPAMVLITDGVPWPTAGQSTSVIENLINSNSNVALFVILLKTSKDSSSETSRDYESYINFWKQVQTRSQRIFVYPISDPNQIEETYNQIVAQLQETIPAKGVSISAGKPTTFYVGNYLEKVIITIIRRDLRDHSPVLIIDPKGNPVAEQEPGVGYFKGNENPIEVVSITAPRLANDLKGANWTVNSQSNVTVLIDRQGSYKINFLEPVAGETDVNNVFLASETVNPSREVFLRFNLIDSQGNVVHEAQLIKASATKPDGAVTVLPGTTDLRPNDDGVYSLRVEPGILYPPILTQPGRFIFDIAAGRSDETAQESPPVTATRLIVDMGRHPSIRSINPQPLVCAPDWDTEVRVTLDDIDIALPESIQVFASSGGQQKPLEMRDASNYRADITDLCQAVIVQQACSSDASVPLTIRLTGQMPDGQSIVPVEQDVQLEVNVPDCTPTPISSPTPVATATPTPIPDSDKDGLNNNQDACPLLPGSDPDNGCPSVKWPLLGLGGAGLAAVMALLVVPWVSVNTYGRPPAAYVQVIQDGKAGKPVATDKLGRSKLTKRIKIGSSRWATIRIPGLKPVEFLVERNDLAASVREAGEKDPFLFLDEEPHNIRTSQPRIMLRIGLDPKRF